MDASKQTKSKMFSSIFKKLWKHYQLTKTGFKATNDPEGNVINLFEYSFTKNQFKVLNKNLNFCPTPGCYNKKEIKTERKIKLKAFFTSTHS